MKSVARQVENARAFAAARGWTVSEPHVFTDDAISGAEVRKLVNGQRLWDALTADRPPVDCLIMRDPSRFSRRDGDEAFGELKRIAQRGVTIYFYSDGSQFTFGSFSANILGFVKAEMAAEYRREVSKWTHEAMIRKANAGHTVGGRAFGFDNFCSTCGSVIPPGKVRCCQGHTDKRINEAQAAVIRRVCALYVDGNGYTRIAKTLNAEGALAPTPTRGQPAGWGPSNVREILRRPLYRGEVIYNQTRRRAADGTATYAERPESEWIRVERPELAIISPDVWAAVRARLEASRLRRPANLGGRPRRRRDVESPYLLSGFARCATCGGTISVLDRRQYGCLARHKRGETVCSNNVTLPVAVLEGAVLEKLHRDVLRRRVVEATLDGVLRELAPATRGTSLTRQRQDIAALDREMANLTTAIAAGGDLPTLVEALKTRQEQRHAAAALAQP